jgi:hypothetical protein
MAHARLDCLKQAIDQKIVGPQRREFVKKLRGRILIAGLSRSSTWQEAAETFSDRSARTDNREPIITWMAPPLAALVNRHLCPQEIAAQTRSWK